MKTWNEPGFGRRKCECGIYIAAKACQCVCGFKFRERKSPVQSPSKTFNKGGRGRKLCKCGKYVGGPTTKCPKCNHIFIKGETTKKRIEKEKKEISSWDNDDYGFLNLYAVSLNRQKEMVVFTPSGDCPHILRSLEELDIFEFCDNTINYGFDNNKLYTPRALKYFGRYSLNLNNQDLDIFCKTVDEWVKTILINV